MSEFYTEMADILEVDAGEIGPDFSLEQAGWDSLAIVSTIALIDDIYGVAVKPDALAECKTIGDIERLAQESAAG